VGFCRGDADDKTMKSNGVSFLVIFGFGGDVGFLWALVRLCSNQSNQWLVPSSLRGLAQQSSTGSRLIYIETRGNRCIFKF
jgi:hypothetical protein